MKNSGRPDRRIDRMERILAWFDRHLRGVAQPGAVLARGRLPAEPIRQPADGERQAERQDADRGDQPERLAAEGGGEDEVGDDAADRDPRRRST